MASTMLGYEFTNPSPEELSIRRQALNTAGYQGLAVPVLFLLAVWLVDKALVYLWSPNPAITEGDASLTSSSRATSSASIRDKQRPKQPSRVRHAARRLHWFLTTTYWPEFGPLYFQVLGTAYCVGLLYIIIAPTKNDYLHLTKAFGHVAASQLPILYLLSLKSPTLSPVTWITRLTHERLNAIHRLVGRVIYDLIMGHALLYLNFFIAKGVLWKRAGDVDVMTGMTAFAALSALSVMALPAVRQKWYHAGFYRLHVLVSAFVVPVVWFHVPYTRIYVGLAGFLWLLSGVSRRFGGALGHGENVVVTSNTVGKSLVEVVARLESDDVAIREKWTKGWWPGMHAYLNQTGLGPKAPFTVTDVQQEKNGIAVRMIVRNLGGPTTGLLATCAKGEKKIQLKLEGPYGESQEYMPHLLSEYGNSRDVLIVAGGIGATYSLPVYTAFVKAHNKQPRRLKFLWIVKQASEISWGLSSLRELQQPVNVEIFTTVKESEIQHDIDQHGIEGLSIIRGNSRPDMREQVGKFFLSGRDVSERAAVFVCGPPGLSQSLREQVGRYVKEYGIDVAWYEEQFGFGGS